MLTSDGIELAVRWWLANPEARACVVLVPGFAGSKDDRHVGVLAQRLRQAHLDVLSYDARGHGQSEGWCTLGELEHQDVAAATATARDRNERVVLVGASMGAVAVIAYAATDPQLAGVVAVSSPADWRLPLTARAVMTAALARTGAGRWLASRRMRVRVQPVWTPTEPPRALVARVAAPLVVIHGKRDRLVPARVALDVSAKEGGSSRFVLVPDMGHAFHPAGHAAICEAVDWTLAAGP